MAVPEIWRGLELHNFRPLQILLKTWPKTSPRFSALVLERGIWHWPVANLESLKTKIEVSWRGFQNEPLIHPKSRQVGTPLPNHIHFLREAALDLSALWIGCPVAGDSSAIYERVEAPGNPHDWVHKF